MEFPEKSIECKVICNSLRIQPLIDGIFIFNINRLQPGLYAGYYPFTDIQVEVIRLKLRIHLEVECNWDIVWVFFQFTYRLIEKRRFPCLSRGENNDVFPLLNSL